MKRFDIKHAVLSKDVILFPEPVQNERKQWGSASVQTHGRFKRYRFVVGNLHAVMARAQTIAARMTATRSRTPLLDQLALGEELPSVTPTTVEYYPYAGRIDTVSRESVIYLRGNERRAFNRDYGVGFQGIITRSSKSWDVMNFAASQVVNSRLRALALNRAMPGALGTGVPTQPAWAARHAAEQQILDTVALSWQRWVAEPTEANMTAVLAVQAVYDAYVMRTMQWLRQVVNPHEISKLPMPSPDEVVALWKADRLTNPVWDALDPWWKTTHSADNPPSVTVIRAAYLSTQRLEIRLAMRPRLNAMQHPVLPLGDHFVSYAHPGPLGLARLNPSNNPRDLFDAPFVGATARDNPWDGALPLERGWSAFSSEDVPSEPTMAVNDVYVSLPSDVARHAETALTGERPTLFMFNFAGHIAPTLALPTLLFDSVMVTPVYETSQKIVPIQADCTVKGTVTRALPGGAILVNGIPSGFTVTPGSTLPIRRGVVQEIIPSY